MLTKKQRELLVFIHSRLHETGVSPSFDEMRQALDLRSKSGIHRLVGALEERGFIRRLPNRARALEVIKLPSATANNNSFTPSVIAGGKEGGDELIKQAQQYQDEAQSVTLPVMGRIAAGTPIAAIQTHLRDVGVPQSMLRSGEHFALEVKGDSMIEAGILDGDIAIIRKNDDALNGDIVVAIIEDKEATLKRLRKRGDSIALEASNAAYETRIFRPEQVKVQGSLVGLFREY